MGNRSIALVACGCFLPARGVCAPHHISVEPHLDASSEAAIWVLFRPVLVLLLVIVTVLLLALVIQINCQDPRWPRYKALDEDGICRIGARLDPGTIMVNKHSPSNTSGDQVLCRLPLLSQGVRKNRDLGVRVLRESCWTSPSFTSFL